MSTLQATIVLKNVDSGRVEGFLYKHLYDYYTDFEVFEDNYDTIVEVYSENEEAGYEAVNISEDAGYFIIEYIIE